jgi:hypothetical protein
MWAFGQSLGRDLARAQLVRGVGIGVQEVDHQRLAARVEQRRDRGAQRVLVERGQHAAARVHPLGHLQPQVAGDHGREAPVMP